MTVHQALKRANIEFKALDSEIIGTNASLKARDLGVEIKKVVEYPWHKREKNTYLVNDFPESFVPELFTLIAEHFTLLSGPKKRRKRIIKE